MIEMKQWTDRLLAGGFVLALFSMSLLFIIRPVQSFSELENRYLQQLPLFSWEHLLSRKFAEDTEAFISDQFPYRAQWVGLKSTLEQLRLQQENNGIYRGENGYLIEKFAEPDWALVQRYAEVIQQFALSHQRNTTFMLIPTSAGLYQDRLPWMAPIYPQAQVHSVIAEQVRTSLHYLDGFDILTPHAEEEIYYRTDHHWTTYGAYIAYQAFAEQWGWKPMTPEQFHIETVSDSFLGSYHTRSQFASIRPDTIERYTPREPIPVDMYIVDSNNTMHSLYDDSYLEKKDQYSYFLGGVHALMQIHSQPLSGQVELEKLLVIKDSYAHNLIPFLTLHVPEIHVIDIRYYNGSINEYMEAQGIEDVLLLFNTTTFVDNSAILKLRN